MTREELNKKLEGIKILEARTMIAKETKNHAEMEILHKRIEKWQTLIEKLHDKGMYASAYILNQYYYHNKTLKEIASDLDYNSVYVSELKRKVCDFIIENGLEKYVK